MSILKILIGIAVAGTTGIAGTCAIKKLAFKEKNKDSNPQEDKASLKANPDASTTDNLQPVSEIKLQAEGQQETHV